MNYLELQDGYTLDDLKAAYRQAAQRHHPDKGGDPADFAALTAEYKRLVKAWRPPVCAACNGTGKTVVQAGFSVLTKRCAACQGSGRGDGKGGRDGGRSEL